MRRVSSFPSFLSLCFYSIPTLSLVSLKATSITKRSVSQELQTLQTNPAVVQISVNVLNTTNPSFPQLGSLAVTCSILMNNQEYYSLMSGSKMPTACYVLIYNVFLLASISSVPAFLFHHHLDSRNQEQQQHFFFI